MKYEIEIITLARFGDQTYTVHALLTEDKWSSLRTTINNPEIPFIKIYQEEADYYIRADKIVAIKIKQVK